MKIVRKSQAFERKNSEICIVTEYDIEDKMLDFAIVQINGRYPNSGYAVNKKCKEIVYVNEGKGIVFVNSEEFEIGAGDVILIEADEKFYWQGNIQLLISCRPAFNIEQHRIVD